MRLRAQAEKAVSFLEDLAFTLEGWASQSRNGGWSTHQVAGNLEQASECRRRASSLRRAIEQEDERPHHCPGCDGDHI